jgi:solute carrier family 25 protein 39/40
MDPETDQAARLPREITSVERMLAACSGSIVTSLIVTPLDVVRVRLQQQEILLPNSECCKRQVFWSHDACATIDEICITDKKMTGIIRPMLEISQKEGILTLWRGLSLTLLMAAPSNIVYFTGYEYMKERSPISHYETINPLICGSMARALAGTVVSPIELLRTRLQSIPHRINSSTSVMGELFSTVRSEIRSRGPTVLFRGLSLTLWRDVPFSGIYWANYEFFKKHLSANFRFFKTEGVDKNKTLDYDLFFNSFLSGSISGSIAAVFTNPFDVGKTRLQISSEPTNNNSLTAASDKSMLKFMKDIVRYEGFGALYVGLLPRLLKIAPSCAIMISSYELGKRFFANS